MIQIKVGRLTLGQILGPKLTNRTRILCKCDCGNEKAITWRNIKCGDAKSCGCLKRSVLGDSVRTHGKTGTTTYWVWKAMRQRCNNPKCKSYPDYGGRGINVCERWNSFENFLEDVGEIPKGMSIDRIDNDKGYAPENVRLVDRQTQNSNTRKNIRVELDGVERTLCEWCEYLGLPYKTIQMRVQRGSSPVEALTTPILKTS